MPEPEYNATELMIINAARLLKDGDQVFVGVGIPNLACNLARRTHAPNLQMIYEAGVIGARPNRLPLSIGDPTLVSGALAVCSMFEVFSLYLQRGNIDVGFWAAPKLTSSATLTPRSSGITNTPKCGCPALAVRWKLPPGPTAVTSSPHTSCGASPPGWIFTLRLAFWMAAMPAPKQACAAPARRRS